MLGALRKKLLDALTALTPPAPLDHGPHADLDDTPRLEACADENEYASRLVEVGLQLTLRRRMDARREEIEAALKRLDLGGYGLCEDCGEDIAWARLLANPTAQLCVHCQAERETLACRRCA